jgi:hypothetical protein
MSDIALSGGGEPVLLPAPTAMSASPAVIAAAPPVVLEPTTAVLAGRISARRAARSADDVAIME